MLYCIKHIYIYVLYACLFSYRKHLYMFCMQVKDMDVLTAYLQMSVEVQVLLTGNKCSKMLTFPTLGISLVLGHLLST